MTWAERVGDLAATLALVVINLLRIATFLIRIATDKLDGLVTGLGERSEAGLRPTELPGNVWTKLPASVLWGIAAIVLRGISIVTVFLRQLSTTGDEFLRVLAEGEAGAEPATASPAPASPGPAPVSPQAAGTSPGLAPTTPGAATAS